MIGRRRHWEDEFRVGRRGIHVRAGGADVVRQLPTSLSLVLDYGYMSLFRNLNTLEELKQASQH